MSLFIKRLFAVVLGACTLPAAAATLDMSGGQVRKTSPDELVLSRVQYGNASHPMWLRLKWDAASDSFKLMDSGEHVRNPRGRWTLNYDWSCSSNGAQVELHLSGDGTCQMGANRCTWFEAGNGIHITVGTRAHYTGTFTADAMSGTMEGAPGVSGCWDAARHTAP